MTRTLLLTGYARSGITLTHRLLSAHPDGYLADRIALDFLADAMTAYRQERGVVDSAYPLDSLFGGPLTLDEITAAFRTRRWPWPPAERSHEPPADGTIGVILSHMAAAAARRAERPASTVVGLREHFVEALAPALVEQGVCVLVLLRNPMDVVASARLGDHGFALNRRVTVLDMVRQWRKSVAVALTLEGHPLFRAVRYEDLVTERGTWESICSWLGLTAVPAGDLLAPEQDHPWAGNSSFEIHRGLSRSPIGRGALLPPSVRAFVAGATGPERLALRYGTARDPCVDYGPAAEIDAAVAPAPAVADAENEREHHRMKLLEHSVVDSAEARRWLLTDRAAATLRSAWSGAHPPAPAGGHTDVR